MSINSTGLQIVLESINAMMRDGKGLKEIEPGFQEFRQVFSRTLLDKNTYGHVGILGKYAEMVLEALRLLSEAIYSATGLGRQESEIVSKYLMGMIVSSDKCLFIRFTMDASLRGIRRRAGSIACVEKEKAVHLILGGFAEPLYTGLEKFIEAKGL
ncbi:hypothetical protein PYJP_14610 [Pyrofollis japonicus]|uniref:hypothetical protein n=1 Tax=Pyrofollis japonicus TaxID=3060460 RepID=UPI00295C369F|nr:hypothetical protein [Pyrofollis japonicus]BEP18109.1 hypothetical protein PYJP_14610 [Pyrofollis japonicus]